MNDYGFFLEQTGFYARAEAILREVVQHFLDRAGARLNLADALWHQKKTDEVIAHYKTYEERVSQGPARA